MTKSRRGWTAEQALGGVSLRGKRAIVTGATSGIGRETARVLARAGAEVVLAVRDTGAGRRLAEELAAQLPSGVPAPRAEELDLTDLASVTRFVARAGDAPLDLLVNNAGVMATPLGKTAQGLELQLGTNHLGHFALTLGLLPLLSAAPAARVVAVASDLHRRGRGARLLETMTHDPAYERRPYVPFDAYGDAKLANVLFVQALARRAPPNVVALSLHPGVIPTNLTRSLGWRGAVFRAVGRYFMKSIPEGAATSVFAAVSPELAGASGAYLSDCALATPSAEAQSTELAERLWAESVRWTSAS